MKLTVFATTDIHGAIYPYDYFNNTEKDMSLLHIKSYIDRYKQNNADETVLTVDNGDIIQGDVWSDYDYSNRGDHLLVPEIINEVYDVVGLGNHEFNFGLDYLHKVCSNIRPDIINSNVDFKDHPLKDRVLPYTIIERETPDGVIKIGFLSVVPTQILKWDAFHLKGRLTVADMRRTVEETAGEIKAEGADLIILLSHSGLSKNPDHLRKFGENQTLLMTMIKDVDGIVFGHTHEFFPDADFEVEIDNIDFKKGTINGKPMVQPGVYASHLGQLSFEVQKIEGSWKITERTAQLIDTETIHLDPVIKNKYASAHNRVQTFLSQPVGHIEAPWHTFFSRVFPSKAVQVVAEAGKAYTEKLIESGEIENLPVLGFNAAIKAGRDGANDFTVLEPGPVTLADAIDLYKHANSMIIIKINGRTLKEWLEWSASQFNSPADTDCLLKPNRSRDGFPSYNYDTFFDLDYVFDITRPPKYDSTAKHINDSSRLVEVKFKGRPVNNEDAFIIPANNYRAAYTSFLREAEILHESQLNVRDIVIDYMKGDPQFILRDPMTILPRGTYRIRTATKAKEYITEDQPIKHLEKDTDGFSWYEITLD
ncbi:5'-nucleotidase C-terminal domain-containing protein [Salinicoccus sp. HZC-1]|uniref:5'-nucleotidase C-terminal domain-containing protein n=1 Tax=Salinicoccus sp. HZC-1 TaxID=3385497 RepID=UPI00398B7419